MTTPAQSDSRPVTFSVPPERERLFTLRLETGSAMVSCLSCHHCDWQVAGRRMDVYARAEQHVCHGRGRP